MINYIVATYLLSIIGGISYWLLSRKHLSPKFCKLTIYLIIILSLTLPLLVSKNLSYFSYTIPVAMGNCSNGVCSTSVFRNITFFDLLINYNKPIIYGTLTIAGLILLLLVFRVGYLLFLIRTSKVEQTEIEGKQYHILYSKRKLSVGSFRFFKKYII